MGSCVMIVIVNFSSDTSKCADKLWHFLCACTVVFLLKKVEQMIMTSFYDITMIFHAIGEETI